MSDTFTALVLRETEDGQSGALEQLTDADLPDGDVTIDVEYSSLNYKDGLALTGKGRIVRSYPMVPGIDLWAHAGGAVSGFLFGVMLSGFVTTVHHFGGGVWDLFASGPRAAAQQKGCL